MKSKNALPLWSGSVPISVHLRNINRALITVEFNNVVTTVIALNALVTNVYNNVTYVSIKFVISICYKLLLVVVRACNIATYHTVSPLTQRYRRIHCWNNYQWVLKVYRRMELERNNYMRWTKIAFLATIYSILQMHSLLFKYVYE